MQNSDTSWPSRNSSTSTGPCGSHTSAWRNAASRSSVTMTPLPEASPSALITYGAPYWSRVAATSASSVRRTARPVGTPARCITSFANVFEPSSCAAAFDGPNTGTPSARTASATPATSGASGPITTRSIDSSRTNSAMSSGSDWLMRIRSASVAMPMFPGAATISCAFSFASECTRACSRAPEPSTRIFTVTD